MNSIAFPKMFNSSATLVANDYDATLSNLKLLLLSDQSGLFGDPGYGTGIKRLLFEQNTGILRDVVIDEIYTAIITFMPQIQVKRSDIKVTSDGYKIMANIKALNMLDYTTDMYNLVLMNYEEL